MPPQLPQLSPELTAAMYGAIVSLAVGLMGWLVGWLKDRKHDRWLNRRLEAGIVDAQEFAEKTAANYASEIKELKVQLEAARNEIKELSTKVRESDLLRVRADEIQLALEAEYELNSRATDQLISAKAELLTREKEIAVLRHDLAAAQAEVSLLNKLLEASKTSS